jgi:hypothetical protein
MRLGRRWICNTSTWRPRERQSDPRLGAVRDSALYVPSGVQKRQRRDLPSGAGPPPLRLEHHPFAVDAAQADTLGEPTDLGVQKMVHTDADWHADCKSQCVDAITRLQELYEYGEPFSLKLLPNGSFEIRCGNYLHGTRPHAVVGNLDDAVTWLSKRPRRAQCSAVVTTRWAAEWHRRERR